MATVTRENIGLLNDKLTVQVAKEDYLPSFKTSLRNYAKKANIPGFRKGMVPASLVKKMYGQGVFTDEILRTVEKELNDYMVREQLDIFGQPLPLNNYAPMLDINNPGDYAFSFEIGLKPAFYIDPKDIKVTRYVVQVTDEMVNNDVSRLQTRYGKITDPETVSSDEDVLNIQLTEADENGNEIEAGISKSNSLPVKYFTEETRKELVGKKKDESIIIQLSKAFDDKERDFIISDLGLNKDNSEEADKYFKITITRIGLAQKAELNEEFFEAVYPAGGIRTEEEFRDAVKTEIENYYKSQSSNQIYDQIYHYLVDNTQIKFPETFLKRWLKDGGKKPKTADEAEKEYPSFVNQLKWTLISSKLINENHITVKPDEIKEFAKRQILDYTGHAIDEAIGMDEHVNGMLTNKKFVDETYVRLQTNKLFVLLNQQVQVMKESISTEDFVKKLHHHHH